MLNDVFTPSEVFDELMSPPKTKTFQANTKTFQANKSKNPQKVYDSVTSNVIT